MVLSAFNLFDMALKCRLLKFVKFFFSSFIVVGEVEAEGCKLLVKQKTDRIKNVALDD